jgi:hypothetical protein
MASADNAEHSIRPKWRVAARQAWGDKVGASQSKYEFFV